MNDEYFPTEFAMRMAREVKLYPSKSIVDYVGEEKNKMIHLDRMLIEFQRIAVLHGSEKAMQIYMLFDLNEKQEKTLKMIGDFAPLQVSGEAMESMMQIVKSQKGHRDYSRIVDALMEAINENENEYLNGKKMKNLIDDLLK